jgi:hypothetical protein
MRKEPYRVQQVKADEDESETRTVTRTSPSVFTKPSFAGSGHAQVSRFIWETCYMVLS